MEILTWNFRKKLFRDNFSENLCKPRLSSTKTREIFTLFSVILSWVRMKRFTQVPSYVVCTQVMRHVHKQITKRRYGEEKPGCFVSGKPVLFFLGLGPTTPYSLGILVWNIYQTFLNVSTEFWLRFEPKIYPTKFAIIFLFITARVERKVRLCVKLFNFFPKWIIIRLSWILSRFVPNSVEILTRYFSKKLFRKNFSEILCKPRLSSTKTREILALLSAILSWVRIVLKRFIKVPSYVVGTKVRRHVHKQIT